MVLMDGITTQLNTAYDEYSYKLPLTKDELYKRCFVIVFTCGTGYINMQERLK